MYRKLLIFIMVVIFIFIVMQCQPPTSEPTPTTYSVRNSSSYTLYDVTSYYWDGSNIYDMNEHGTMYSGNETGKIGTNRDKIGISLELLPGGNMYIVVNKYPITENQNTVCAIYNSTELFGSSVLPDGRIQINYEDVYHIDEIKN